jgi:hypothetical protein
MKWMVFTGAAVAALITLGILAVDERDVVWEGRKPLCPYCRSPIEMFALACKSCGRAFDWSSTAEECRWCLSGDVADELRDQLALLGLDEAEEGKPGGPLGDFSLAWLRAIDEGSCAYCGGIGRVANGTKERTCPVCFGKKRCISCGGDRTVVVGDSGAHRRMLERAAALSAAENAARITGLALNRDGLSEQDVAELRGTAEAESLVDVSGRPLVELGIARAQEAFRILREAAAAAERPPPSRPDAPAPDVPPGGSTGN